MTETSDTVDDRLAKEKKFHDERFADDTLRHSAVTKYYAIATPLFNDYQSKLLADCANKVMVEYGCGTGSQAFLLAENGAKVTGIDISSVAIAEATKLGESTASKFKPSFLEMNAEQLNFEESSVDTICGSSILHHLDLEKSMSEIHRVLKPGGQALFIEPLGHNPLINLYRFLTPKLRTDDEHPLTDKDLVTISENFAETNIKYYFIFSIGASFFHGTKLFSPLLTILGSIDGLVLKIKPLRKFAWFTCIQLIK